MSAESIAQELTSYVYGSMHKWYQFVGSVFESLLNVILHTPEKIVMNPEVQRMWWIFVGVAIAMLSVMTVIEGILIASGRSRSNLMQLMGRTSVAFLLLGFVIPGMTYAVKVVNGFIEYLVKVAHHNMDIANAFANSFSDAFINAEINFVASVIFLFLFVYFMFKILMYYGRRWFDIMVSAIISPLAFASLIFESTTHYFQKWWSNVVQLYLVQVVHAVYAAVIGMIILAPGTMHSMFDAWTRSLLLIGALWRMATPPQFVSSMSGSPDSRNMIRDITRNLSKLRGGKK